ncbi:hypothetical protein PInf_021995 [Phytophthora infestans]|nr:hypothetical protein PInf_021995 [Phytophthora infestans]
MSKTPSMLLRPSAGGSPGSTGVLYEPDATSRSRHSVSDRDSHLQVNTRPTKSSPSHRRAGSPGAIRPQTPSTLQQIDVVPPSTSVKLITPQLQFATDLSTKIGDKELFSTRSLDALVMDRHETTGVDLAISMVAGAGHPTVLLDSQPLLSSSMLADLLERNESQRFNALTPEQQIEAASYQIAVFLCSICHYVVVVHDGLAYQASVTDLLRKIEQKLAQCRLPSVSGNSQRHTAQLLYVANNVADSELLYRENELLSAHTCALEAVWPHALVRVPYNMSTYSDVVDDKDVLNVASFVLPHRQQVTRGNAKRKEQIKKTASISSKYSELDEAAEDFQLFVRSLPSSPTFSSNTVSKLAMTPGSKPLPPPHALSLREWLSNASRVFEAVRKASCFTAEYTSSRDQH